MDPFLLTNLLLNYKIFPTLVADFLKKFLINYKIFPTLMADFVKKFLNILQNISNFGGPFSPMNLSSNYTKIVKERNKLDNVLSASASVGFDDEGRVLAERRSDLFGCRVRRADRLRHGDSIFLSLGDNKYKS